MIYGNSWLDIVNRALVKTGNQHIDSLKGNTPNIVLVNTLLPSAIDNVISLYPWRCCIKRFILAPITVNPEFEYKYSYPLPNDFVMLMSVFAKENKWVREGKTILTNSDECKIIYVSLPDNPNTLTPDVKELISLRLAYNLVQSTTSNTGLMQLLMQEFASALKLAMSDETSGEEDITTVNSIYNSWNDYR